MVPRFVSRLIPAMRSRLLMSVEARHFSGSSSLPASVTTTTTPSTTTTKTIGFIGLGNMGLPMCLNLATNNKSQDDLLFQVLAFDTNTTALATATQKAGVQAAKSIDDIGAAHCSIIFTMLPGCSAVDAVTARLLQQIGDNNDSDSVLFVDCSTVRCISVAVVVLWYWNDTNY
jgi:NAD binding domain of 6-phosphogluconate dehydrogenase